MSRKNRDIDPRYRGIESDRRKADHGAETKIPTHPLQRVIRKKTPPPTPTRKSRRKERVGEETRRWELNDAAEYLQEEKKCDPKEALEAEEDLGAAVNAPKKGKQKAGVLNPTVLSYNRNEFKEDFGRKT